jgi:hypothetical protein
MDASFIMKGSLIRVIFVGNLGFGLNRFLQRLLGRRDSSLTMLGGAEKVKENAVRPSLSPDCRLY